MSVGADAARGVPSHEAVGPGTAVGDYRAVTGAGSSAGAGDAPDEQAAAYYATRFTPDPSRAAVWRHIAAYLQRWIPADAAVLDLAAGYGDFAGAVRAASVCAIDRSDELVRRAAPHVRCTIGDAVGLDAFAAATFDVVFSSNFLEHLEHAEVERCLASVRRVLRPRGRLLLVQPNFRLAPRAYFDDYTHRTIWTDRSLADRVAASGFDVLRTEARFLPLTMKSRFSRAHVLVPAYLRLPSRLRPLAGQMLVVAEVVSR